MTRSVVTDYQEHKPHRKKRIAWAIINSTIYRWAGGKVGWPVRKALLRLFGAKIDSKAYIYAKCRIFAPWLLEVGRACVGPRTEIYNKAKVVIGDETVVSQGAFLCTASHDISLAMRPLVTGEIVLGNDVWVAANAFVGPGVTIGDGAVVGATASVFKSVEPYMVVGGNPAKVINKRVIKDSSAER